MAGTLTQQDIAQLTQYANNGDRYNYWNYLAAKGDSYARLALGVVSGATLDGYVANHYAASYAPAGSSLANPDNTQAWWSVGVDLMKADLAARQNLGNTLDLPFQAIYTYHSAIFANSGLPQEAWTPYIPFKGYITNGDWATANQLWHQAINGSGITAEVTANLTAMLGSRNSLTVGDAAIWGAKTGSYLVDYNNASVIVGGDRNSLRNSNYIGGWSYNPSSGQWTQTMQIPMDPFGRSTVYTADPATTQFLNQERQF